MFATTAAASAALAASMLSPIAPAASMLAVQDVPANYYAATEKCYALEDMTGDYGDCVMSVDMLYPMSANDFYSSLDFESETANRFFTWLDTGVDYGWAAFSSEVISA